MNKTQIFDFLEHRLSAKTRHGVHSPFVYDLIESCIYGANRTDLSPVLRYFRDLRASKARVSGIDFGRSETSESDYRVGYLARTSSIADYQVKLLCRLAEYHNASKVLELGTNLGKTSAALASAMPSISIQTVEGNQGISQLAQDNFKHLGLGGIQVHNSTFDEFLSSDSSHYDLIFLDGDHRYEPTMRYFHMLKQRLAGEGPLILHDIHWSNGMLLAWKEVCSLDEATVTIDLHCMGLVYFRPNQRKEHFKIRFPRSVRGFF